MLTDFGQYNVETGLNALDLGYQMRKLEKAGRARHTYKVGEEVKDTFVTLEVNPGDEATSTEFTSNASLRQLLCLLPSDKAAESGKGDDSSDDSINGGDLKRAGNLEPTKRISAFIRVAKQATEINARPKASNIIRQSKKTKPVRQ